ncbi:MAG: YgiT-type zinc finger protein [Dehalococcoidia bacterium]
MNCTIADCPGTHEERYVIHAVRYGGQGIVIDHVPAEVCCACGDVLFKPETVRYIEKLLQAAGEPAERISLYRYT